MKPEQAPANEQLETIEKNACASDAQADLSCSTRNKRVLFVVLAAAWVALDAFTKAQFHGGIVGRVVFGPVLGLFDFRLIHNTGGAWGIFSDSTFALGVFSLAVCLIASIYFFIASKHMNLFETVGFALVVAGGIGNAIDRFLLGYVVDFIEFAFFEFPVFNVADIGVTCGFVILIIGLIVDFSKGDESDKEATKADKTRRDQEGNK